MQTTETMRMPALGESGEPCAECGAPLAADQRYCLNCGRRRTGPRLDYRRYLESGADRAPAPPAASPPAPPPEEPPAPPASHERDLAPLAAVGGIAVLGLMLLVGVLIGRGGDPGNAAPPQVVTVAAPESGQTASAETGGRAAGSATPSEAKGRNGTGAKAVAGGLTGEAARRTEATVQASQGDLEALNEQSGDAYQDAVKKLPDKIATPGAPPPVDKSKAPGGGSGALTIE